MSLSGDVVNITDKTIISDDVTLSFGLGNSAFGAAINHVTSSTDESLSSYSLSLRVSATVTVSVPVGYVIDNVYFEGYTADLIKRNGEPGLWNAAMKSWSANGDKVNEVTFINGYNWDTRITGIKVLYTRPSTPLLLSSTSIIGGLVKSFKSATLKFNTPVSKVLKPKGVVLVNPANVKDTMTISNSSGNEVTISLPKEVELSGTYTLNIEAGTFQNTEGSLNDAITLKFKVRIPVMPVSIDPAEGSIRTLPTTINLTFKNQVRIATNEAGLNLQGYLYHNGVMINDPVDMVLRPNSYNKVVQLTLVQSDEDESGNWSIIIPNGCIHNTFANPDLDSWNDDITISYKVEVIEPDELKLANSLRLKRGVGYPTEESEGRKNLEDVVKTAYTTIANGEDPEIQPIVDAIAGFYNETDVELPADGNWYQIAGVNNADKPSEVYLYYEKDSVRLTTESSLATSFQAVKKGDNLLFRTADKKKFLSVLTDKDGSMTTKANTTTDSTRVALLSLSKLKVTGCDSTKTFGKLTMRGVMDVDTNWQPVYSFSTIDYSDALNPEVALSPVADAVFDELLSSAFVIEPASAPFDSINSIYPEAKFEPSNKVKAGAELTLTILNAKEVKLVKPDNPYYTKLVGDDWVKVNFEGTILTPVENTDCDFSVNTKDLSVGHYSLVMPKGTFTYVKYVKDVVDQDIFIDFDIISGEGGSDNPNPDDPNPDDPNPEEPDPGFKYTFNSMYTPIFLPHDKRNTSVAVADTTLNNLVIFVNLGNPYSGIIPDPTKKLQIVHLYKRTVYGTGHFEPYPTIKEDYPELDLFNVQAIKLVMDEPIQYGAIGEATVTYIIPKATFGDANFGLWLEDHNSVNPEDCIVNKQVDEMVAVINNRLVEETITQGIRTISPATGNADAIYDLRGRRVAGQLKPGVYIINGHKRVVR